MKRLLLGDSREDILSTLEVILRHWGCRVLATSRPALIEELLRETAPGLLILGARLLADPDSALSRAVTQQVAAGRSPLVVLREEGCSEPAPAVPHDSLDVPIDLFALFGLVQRHMHKHPRRNLRLDVHLPGLFCAGGSSHFADIISLSAEGLLLRTCFRLGEEKQLKITFPLLGMKREIEMEGRILYRIDPCAANNYMQGVGIEFINLDKDTRRHLRLFLENRFLGNLADRPDGQRVADAHRSDGDDIVLRLGD